MENIDYKQKYEEAKRLLDNELNIIEARQDQTLKEQREFIAKVDKQNRIDTLFSLFLMLLTGILMGLTIDSAITKQWETNEKLDNIQTMLETTIEERY